MPNHLTTNFNPQFRIFLIVYKCIASKSLNIAYVVHSFIYVYIIAGTHVFRVASSVVDTCNALAGVTSLFRSLLICITSLATNVLVHTG
jgi:hypothetical protein